MSHVDEGALHAYLDGALDEYPSGQARRIRAHLERCERCVEALAEARRSRDAAERILASPELTVVPPPIEELKRLARSSEPREPRRRTVSYRLGWAASVVLALGAGWLLRGGSAVAPTLDADRAVMSAESAAAPSVDAMDIPAPARMAEVGRTAREDVAPMRTSEVPAAPEPLRAPTVEVAPVLGADDALADDALVERLTAPPGALTTDAVTSLEALEETRVAEARGGEVRAAAPTGRGSPSETQAGVTLSSRMEASTGLMSPTGFDRSRAEGPRSSERTDEPGSLVVPGLEVLSIVWREEGVTPAGVRVLQRLTDGGELELIHLPEGFEPELVERPAAGITQLVVPREQGWLILRAALEEDALADLLRRLDEAPPR